MLVKSSSVGWMAFFLLAFGLEVAWKEQWYTKSDEKK